MHIMLRLCLCICVIAVCPCTMAGGQQHAHAPTVMQVSNMYIHVLQVSNMVVTRWLSPPLYCR